MKTTPKRREAMRLYYQKNRKKIDARARERYFENHDRELEKAAEYRRKLGIPEGRSHPRKSPNRECSYCNKKFRLKPYAIARGRGKYCSIICKANSQYRGNKTVRELLMGRKEYKQWRKAVFERDMYTCQLCHKKGGYLEADHIKPWAKYPELRYLIENGRTLCRPCHLTTETWGNRGATV